MKWNTYILLCDSKIFYVGITNNLEKRLRDHGRGYSPYTKKFKNIKLVHTEEFKSRQESEQREYQLKGWSVAKKKTLISGNKQELVNLSKSRELVDGEGGEEY